MDAIENGIISLRKASRHWKILITSLSNHLYVKTRSKKPGQASVLLVKKD
jgi:hypothetical protein